MKTREEILRYKKEYREKNRETLKQKKKKWNKENSEHVNSYNKKYRKENPEKVKQWENTKERIEYKKKWLEENLGYMNRYIKKRKKEDINFDISIRIRSRINSSMKNKSNSSFELLGCDILFYINHLESLFQEGMTWENRNEWHIDHKKPIISFDLTDENQLFECFNYKNTQPLWAKDNLSKGGRF